MKERRNCFAFGQNYDSDYLRGKRLRRKSIREHNNRHQMISKNKRHLDKHSTRKVGSDRGVVKKKTRKQRVKRLTLAANNGIFANGLVSKAFNAINEVNSDVEARINADLHTILNKRADRLDRPDGHERHNNRDVSIQNCMSRERQNSSLTAIKKAKLDKTCNSDKMSITGVTSNRINTNRERKSECLVRKTKTSNTLKTSQRILPTASTIVLNLMTDYTEQRMEFAKRVPEFGNDLKAIICNDLRQTCALNGSPLSAEWLESVVNDEQRREEIAVEAKGQLNVDGQPLRQMLCKVMKYVSEAFETLSTKCAEKSFYD